SYFGCFKFILNILYQIWEFLNSSQLVSSVLGAAIGGWIALIIANNQSEVQKRLFEQEIKENRKQRKKENEQQKTFFRNQEENERERIFLQLVLERLENAYEILSKLYFAPDIIGRKIVPALAQHLPASNPEVAISEYEFREAFLKIQHLVLDPEFEQQTQLLFQLNSILILHDHIEIQARLSELKVEFEKFEKNYYEFCQSKSLQECLQISSSYSKNQTLSAAVDQFMREISIYLGELASQLLSEERQRRIEEDVDKFVSEGKIKIVKL
ncbi:TPA: hypothetical protein ACGOWH_001861, partial [Streptococcus suis]